MIIPKLANGGIIKKDSLFVAKEKGKDLFYDKYYVIYKRTKNRRIKKKQLKKSWILKAQKQFEQVMPKIDFNNLQIFIGGKEIKTNEK